MLQACRHPPLSNTRSRRQYDAPAVRDTAPIPTAVWKVLRWRARP